MSDHIDTVTVLGVSHSDERLPNHLWSFMPDKTDILCHERGDRDPSSEEVVQAAAHNPALLFPGLLLYLPRIVRRQWTHGSTNHSWCREAVEQIAEEHDLKLVDIGKIHIDRIRDQHFIWAPLSWVVTLLSLLTLSNLLLVRSGEAFLYFSIATFLGGGLFILIYALTRSTGREKYMFANVLEETAKNGCRHPVIVTGEQHVLGICKRAEAVGANPERKMVSSTLDQRSDALLVE